MTNIRRYQAYHKGQTCSVSGCNNYAEYEVYLYDFYQDLNEEFLEQDFTCPFLCEHHMRENEAQAIGEKKPRGFVSYPYTNHHRAQGYSTYRPVSDVFSEIYSSEGLLVPQIRLEVADVNEELIQYLAQHPDMLYELSSRKFEIVVAELFQAKGFDVELTPATRDGGKDIYAIHRGTFAPVLYVVECKKWTTRPVGVEVVRGLYGVKQAERANVGMVVTTSSFTSDALKFAYPLRYELALADFDKLKSYLAEYVGPKT